MNIVNQIAELARAKNSFLIASHARPDGDSIGSSLALSIGLKALGKEVQVVHADPTPSSYGDLPGVETIVHTPGADGEYDVLFVLECNNLERTGLKGLERFFVVNIDHHPKNDGFGSLNWIDSSAAALGEMIFRLLIEMGVPITPAIATNLYVAILTDTGSFQFSNTSPETFRVAGELVRAGAEPAPIAEAVMNRQSEQKVRLLVRVLQTMQLDESKRMAWIWLDQSMLEETGAVPEDTEGMVSYLLRIEGVVASAFFQQKDSIGWRISLRSQGDRDVAAIAEAFGGGGHENAAGCSLEGSLEEVQGKILGRLARLLNSQ
jgi:phosphoesterase RecJ-like protein